MDNMNMTATVLLKMTPEEKAQAVRDAHRRNMNLSEYIRSLLELGHELLERQK